MHLSLALLGPFQATLDGRPVTEFYSCKVRALLAYLAVEAGRPQARSVLACLLWPDWADRAALGNLRFSLAKLRQAIGDHAADPPFLLITRDAIQLNPAADWDLDVRLFESALAAGRWQMAGGDDRPAEAVHAAIAHLEAASRLYRGSFLEGFAVGDSAAFEDWARLQREQGEQGLRSALHGLAALHARLGDHAAAEGDARRLLALDPWDDLANRHLMAALAAGGQRNAALRHYAAYREEVARELGAEPSGETAALYEQIKRAATPPPAVPAAAVPSLMARESQLAGLQAALGEALAGRGRVAFISGEAGSGKSALLAEFARQAAARHPDLLTAGGRCNAYTGIGDPYLPFREVARLLAGDVEPFAAAGLVTDEQARRLHAAAGRAARTLIDNAPALAGRLVPIQALAAALAGPPSASAGGAAWPARLQALAGQAHGAGAGLDQDGLFSQFTAFLAALARKHPLLLLLDDLQWADNGSLSLLFHLGRRVAGAAILIVAAYRSEDLAAGREGGRHPLQAVVNELRRVHGGAEIDLNEADGRRFVAAVLARHANRLDAGFRETLYRHTGGQPLFTLELLRGLAERGELARAAGGAWVATAALDWRKLPPRVEAVIAERVERLPRDAQDLLAAASVEGEEFTAEVAARVLGLDPAEVLGQLGDVLGRQQRLVCGCGAVWPEGRPQALSRYRFRHALFQAYLYGRLDAVQRAHGHGLTAEALAALYGAAWPEIALQLAWHYERAGRALRAVDCLLEAGDQAMRVGAYRQAVEDFNRGLALLAALPATPARSQQELRLRLALTGPLSMLHGLADPIRSATAAQAVPLSRQAGSGMQAIYALVAEAIACRDRGDFDRAAGLGQQLLALAQASQERRAALLAHFVLGTTAVFSGQIVQARPALETALGLYRAAEDRDLPVRLGADMQVVMLAWLGLVLWLLGYPDQGAAAMQNALDLAQERAQPFTMATTLTNAIWFALLAHSGQDLGAQVAALRRLVDEKQIAALRPWADAYAGWLQIRQGQAGAGIAALRSTLAAWGRGIGVPGMVAILAQACLDAGQYDQGLAVLEEGLPLLETGIGRLAEPEMYRLWGALTLRREGLRGAAVAEDWFHRAIAAARASAARAWELRAAIDLARLWREGGRAAEAQALLAGIYGTFSEGFATPDLAAAAALLDPAPHGASGGRQQDQA